jgi:fructose-bisphosphate aldolase class II
LDLTSLSLFFLLFIQVPYYILLPSIPLQLPFSFNMGVTEKLSRKAGVIVGDDVLRLFEYAQEKQFAIPAIVSHYPGGDDGS